MYSIITNQDAHDAITEQFTRYKDKKTTRQKRMAFAEQLTDVYIEYHGKRPPVSVLDRLATLILQDELADTDPHKTTNTERPFLSENQYRRRTEGRHTGRLNDDGSLKPLKREVPFALAANYGVDGRDYSYPNRRNIDVIEQMDMEYYGKGVDGRGNTHNTAD